MAKKYLSKNQQKKNKSIENKKKKPKKILKTNKIISKKINKPKNLVKLKKKSEDSSEMNKILLDAQAAVKLQCCVCNKNIAQQIKIILFSNDQKTKIHQKGLSFNALCIRCFLFKTKFNSRDNSSYSGNEFNLTNYKFINYCILEKITEPLFTPNWTFGEEIKLLGAVEKLGLNNWEEISKTLGKGKFECEAHYYSFYYKSEKDYLPNRINEPSNKDLENNKNKEKIYLSNIANNIGYIPFTDNNKGTNRSLSKSSKIKKDSIKEKNELIYQNAYETLGYWAKRKEFDVEYKNDAEIELSELEFKDDDTEEEKLMHYKILKNYNNVLDEREQRKNLIADKNLYDIKKQNTFEKKLSQEDKEIYQILKMNFRFLTKEQFYATFDYNVLEKNLKARLNQLLYYQNKGCVTYDDIQQYINNIKKTEKVKEENDDKMKLRNWNSDKKESEEILIEEEKLKKELGMKKKKFNIIKNYICLEIQKGKKRNEVIIQEIKDKYNLNKKSAAKFVEIIKKIF